MERTALKVLEFSGVSLIGVGFDDFLSLNELLSIFIGVVLIIIGYYIDHDVGYDLMAFGLGFSVNAVFRAL